MIYQLANRRVRLLGTGHYIAPNAVLIGDVTLHAGVSIWFGAVLRGDNAPIVVGENSNIQDLCVMHTDPGFELRVGRGVTVGHRVILHSCTVEDDTLIGMGSTIMTAAAIGHDCVIGAKSLVTEHAQIPAEHVVFGFPAKARRTLTDA
ncbi:MAG TPA: gamma carbonic anhydrase family protein, partial [Steroidobacteraceae bacterium]|nr:gamma carbonic anhydrase family protein [Steroidobacteraceae bacterium]